MHEVVTAVVPEPGDKRYVDGLLRSPLLELLLPVIRSRMMRVIYHELQSSTPLAIWPLQSCPFLVRLQYSPSRPSPATPVVYASDVLRISVESTTRSSCRSTLEKSGDHGSAIPIGRCRWRGTTSAMVASLRAVRKRVVFLPPSGMLLSSVPHHARRCRKRQPFLACAPHGCQVDGPGRSVPLKPHTAS